MLNIIIARTCPGANTSSGKKTAEDIYSFCQIFFHSIAKIFYLNIRSILQILHKAYA